MTTTNTLTAQDLSFFSDYYKDAHGCRPRHIDFTSWTREDFDSEVDKLRVIILADIEQDKLAEIKAIANFEARIEETISMGAGNRETALWWLYQPYFDNGDTIDYLLWDNGICIHSKFGIVVDGILTEKLKTYLNG
jgi:hypothetical protein